MKKWNQKGFTLAELLIVVAIIAVLVAISIPVFASQLEKSRESTDLANMRAAKASILTKYLEDDSIKDTVYCYDAAKGILATAATDVTAYGKGTESGAYDTDASGKYFWIAFDGTSEEVVGIWANSTAPALNTLESVDDAYSKP